LKDEKSLMPAVLLFREIFSGKAETGYFQWFFPDRTITPFNDVLPGGIMQIRSNRPS